MIGACYLDLDGTLLGRGASLLHDGEGHVSLLGARAIEACLRADVEIVLMSGRRRAQVAEAARLFGQTAFIYEAGCVLSVDGEEQWLTGPLVPGEQSVYEQIEASGAPAQLRAYHLIPAGASKAAAVAAHMRTRGLERANAFAVGDSREDLGVAEYVETFWLVANALERDPSLRAPLASVRNVRVAQDGHGGGVYEAVITTLAERR